MRLFSFQFKLYLTLFIVSLFFTKVFLLPSFIQIRPKQAEVLSVHEVVNSAYVGIPVPPSAPSPTQPKPSFVRFNLFGYTSSFAVVKLEGIGLSQETKANKTGYFEFNDFLTPTDSREFCLITIDTENLIAPPLCIPVPDNEPGRRYGPYLLPPTLQLAKGDLQTNETGQIIGKTIPHTAVTLNLFDQNIQLSQGIIKGAYAKNNEEKIKLKAADDGSFTSSLTTETSGKKRVFAQALFTTASGTTGKTPKSLTLTINIFSSWLTIVITIWNWLRSLLNLNNLIICQIILLSYLLYKKLFAKKWLHVFSHKQNAIVLYKDKEIIKAEKHYCKLEKTN